MSDNIAAALLEAQKQFKDPFKDSKNPHFKSRFVSLKGVLEAVRPALHAHGIAIVQEVDFDGDRTFVRTRLLHSGGSFLESRCPVIVAKQHDPQAMGSAITYARRYGAAAICGIAPSDDDDDGEGAVDRQPPPAAPKTPVQQKAETIGKVVRPEAYDSYDVAREDIETATTMARLHQIADRLIESKTNKVLAKGELEDLGVLWKQKKQDLG